MESIDTAAKKVKLSNGEERPYDKLILATGAECNIPPIKGADSKNVYVIRKLADANAIREKLDSVTDIAVIGGGVLGLEAAWEFRRGKKNVTIIEVSDGLMKNQLDAHASRILREAAENSGIKVITNAKIDQITESGVIWQTAQKFPASWLLSPQACVLTQQSLPRRELMEIAGSMSMRKWKPAPKMFTRAVTWQCATVPASASGAKGSRWEKLPERTPQATINATIRLHLPTLTAAWGWSCSQSETMERKQMLIIKRLNCLILQKESTKPLLC
ncbi:MAG: FAD-dependent oxidoreductase [Christensenellales bacterium]